MLTGTAIGPAAADSIATDRPGNGNSPSTVPAWRFQIETSASYAYESDSNLVTAPTSLRFGLPGSFELRLISGLVAVASFDSGSTEVGPLDTAIGSKYYITEQRGAVPQLGVVVDVTVPTGDDLFTSDAVIPDARFAAIWVLPAKLSVLANLGVVVPDDAAGRYAQLLYLTSLGYSLTDRLFVFGESFGLIDTSGDRDHLIQLDWGAAYLLADDYQLDVFGQHGITDAAPTFQIAAGFSARL
jgi:hypothetical protein